MDKLEEESSIKWRNSNPESCSKAGVHLTFCPSPEWETLLPDVPKSLVHSTGLRTLLHFRGVPVFCKGLGLRYWPQDQGLSQPPLRMFAKKRVRL